MTELKGIVVRLKCGSSDSAGTAQRLYLGVVSPRDGGREFPLDAPGGEEAEQLKLDVTYWIGHVWDGDVLLDAEKIVGFAGNNDTDVWPIKDLGQVNQVYLRKWGHTKKADDDAYQLKEVEVTLYGEEPEARTFKRRETIWLGAEYGLQVWIPEKLEK